MGIDFLGNCIFFTIGFLIGAAIMYAGPIIIEKLKGEDE